MSDRPALTRALRDAVPDAPHALRFDAGRASGRRIGPGPGLIAPLAVVSIIVLVIATYLAIRSNRSSQPVARPVSSPTTTDSPAPPVPCPSSIPPTSAAQIWVPAPPALATGGHLGPDRVPDSAVVCAYGKPLQGTGRTLITGDLQALTRDLSSYDGGKPTSRACALYLALTDAQSFLIGLRYGSAVVWVAAPGDHCLGSTNGVVSSPANLRADAQQAYWTGRWDTDPRSTEPCGQPSTGGEAEAAAALTHSVRTEVCASANGRWRAYAYTSSMARTELTLAVHNNAGQLAPAGCIVAPTGNHMVLIAYDSNNRATTFAVTNDCVNGAHGAANPTQFLVNDVLMFAVSRL